MTPQRKEDLIMAIRQLLKGQKLEQNRFEIKSSWYNLKDKDGKGYNEFLKDCTSIVNSYGGDYGYIIIGIDQKRMKLSNTTIKDSGLSDPNEVKDILISKVRDAFIVDIEYLEVDGYQLSIIEIPPSTSKPHLVTTYKSPKDHISSNVIFTRNGTGSIVASKGDIDRMYWERGNIVVERKIDVTVKFSKLSIRMLPFTTFDYSADMGYMIMHNTDVLLFNAGLLMQAIIGFDFYFVATDKYNSRSNKFRAYVDSEVFPLLIIAPNTFGIYNGRIIVTKLDGTSDFGSEDADILRIAGEEETIEIEVMHIKFADNKVVSLRPTIIGINF